jgi:hypothetical protein
VLADAVSVWAGWLKYATLLGFEHDIANVNIVQALDDEQQKFREYCQSQHGIANWLRRPTSHI